MAYLNLPLLEQRLHDAAVSLRQTRVVDADAKRKRVLQRLVPARLPTQPLDSGCGSCYEYTFFLAFR